MCTKFHQNFTDCSGHVWGGLGPFRASKSSNMSENIIVSNLMNYDQWTFSAFKLIFELFRCSKRPQPTSDMSWTICEILVKFGTHLGCQIWKKSERGRICDISKNCDWHYVRKNPYFRTYLSFFDALKGPNPAQTCPEQSVKFWWNLVHI